MAHQTDTASAGYFRFILDSPDPRARQLERAVAWRCRALALPYGDQGLLIHRDLLARVGGVRPLPLMEDVDLVRRLGRSRLTPLAADAGDLGGAVGSRRLAPPLGPQPSLPGAMVSEACRLGLIARAYR